MRVVNKGAALRLQGRSVLEIAPGVSQVDIELLRELLRDPQSAAAYDAQCEPWSHEFARAEPGQFELGVGGENGLGRGVLR